MVQGRILSPDERQKITQYLAEGVKTSDIAKLLNRNIKTVKKLIQTSIMEGNHMYIRENIRYQIET